MTPWTSKTTKDHSLAVSRDGSPHARGEGGGLVNRVVVGVVREASE